MYQDCKTLFAGLADVFLAKQPDLAKQASAWAEQNVDSDSSTVIGGIYLETKLSPHYIVAGAWV